MSVIFQIKDVNTGNWIEIPAIMGSVGPAGATPVKGVDYFTEADEQEIVAAVIEALPKAESNTF